MLYTAMIRVSLAAVVPANPDHKLPSLGVACLEQTSTVLSNNLIQCHLVVFNAMLCNLLQSNLNFCPGCCNPIQSNPIQSNPIQPISINSSPLHCSPFQSHICYAMPIHSIQLRSTTFQAIPFQSNPMQSNPTTRGGVIYYHST